MVKAEVEPKVTTIDQESGEVEVTRKGKLTGIGEGFREYINKAAKHKNKVQNVGATVNTGEYPVGHEHEGKWAIQIIVGPLTDKESADVLADRLTPTIEGFLGGRAFKPQ